MWLFDLVLIAVTIWLILQIIRTYGTKIVLIFYIILNLVQQAVSTYYLNSGVFVNELGRTTYYVAGSFERFLFYLDVYLMFCLFWGKRWIKKRKIVRAVSNKYTIMRTSRISIIITSVLLCYLIADMLISGIPLLTSYITRYNFFTLHSRLPFASTINSLLNSSMFLLGYSYAHNKNKWFRGICIIEVIATIVVRVLLDSKMSGIIDTTLNFLAVAVLLGNLNFRRIRDYMRLKYIVPLTLFLLGIIGIFVYNSLVNNTANTISIALELFVNRAFGLGNHLWWAAEADTIAGNGLVGHNFLQEVLSVLEFKTQYDTSSGIYYLMKQYGESYIVSESIKNSVRFASSFLTTAVYNWGYLAAVIPIFIIATITVWFIRIIEYTVIRDYVIQFIFIIKVWQTFVIYVTASGTLTEWMNIENYIYICIFAVLHFTPKKKRITVRLVDV